MKKNLKYLFLLLLIIPTIVKADMAAPAIPSYEATVINPDGASYYSDYTSLVGKLNYEEKLTIIRETIYKGDSYGIFYQNGTEYYVKLKDIQIINNTYDLASARKSDDTKKWTVLVDNLTMYSGPSYSYKKLDTTIPMYTEVTFIYDSDADEETPWHYVEYNGTGGWVITLNGNLGFKDSIDLMPIKQIKLYEDGSKTKEIMVLPANKIIKSLYYTDSWTSMYFISYKNKQGFVASKDVAQNENVEINILSSDVILYSNPDVSSTVIDKNLPKDSNYTSSYNYNYNVTYGWFLITYNNQDGWINYIGDNKNIEVIPTSNNSAVSQSTTAKTVITKNKLNNSEIIMIAVGAGLLIGTLTAVTIILINKKKNNQN
jgi:hypothetical protein